MGRKNKGGVYMESKIEEHNDFETYIAYAELALHTLQNSKTEITPRELGKEMRMLHNKFGTEEIKRLTNIIVKGKK